jgi:hypothetical protein
VKKTHIIYKKRSKKRFSHFITIYRSFCFVIFSVSFFATFTADFQSASTMDNKILDLLTIFFREKLSLHALNIAQNRIGNALYKCVLEFGIHF